METVFNPNQNLNFKRFLLAKLNLIAQINRKILCNDMNATNIDIYLNIFLSFYFSRKKHGITVTSPREPFPEPQNQDSLSVPRDKGIPNTQPRLKTKTRSILGSQLQTCLGEKN
jgi:hypothetical protein